MIGRLIPKNRRHIRNNTSGFTYIAVLILVSVVGICLSGISTYWSTSIIRDKEQELIFRGDQIRKAISLYYQNTPAGRTPEYPARLTDLLKDPRHLTIKRYLRKVYRNPITDQGTWSLILDSNKRIKGVYSKKAQKPLKTANFPKAYRDFEKAQTYMDWKFIYNPS
jgi:type II secretory pathway pseudopilin PulG